MTLTTGNPERLLTVEEVAGRLQVPTSWVYRHARARARPHLPAVKLGKYLRFSARELDRFIDEQGQIFLAVTHRSQ